MIYDLKLYKETYNFILWLYPEIKKFPKSDKFTLGEHIKKATNLFFKNQVSILKNYNRKENLLNADIHLEELRLNIRLCKDLKLLSFNKYEVASKKLDLLGKMLGGLIKKYI